MPEFRADQFIGRTIDAPDRHHVPSRHFTEGLGDFGHGLVQLGGFGQDTAHGILHAKTLLKPLALGNDRRHHQGRQGHGAHKGLQKQKRLIGVRCYEGAKPLQCAPQSDARDDARAHDGAALTKSEGRPQQRQNGQVLQLICLVRRNSSQENNHAHQHHRQQHTGRLRHLGGSESRPRSSQPDQQQRGHD